MQPDFWHERWREGRTGFHRADVHPALQTHWPALGLAAGSRVFVPLCGKTVDIPWLRAQGHAVVGVEFSAIAVEALCMEQGIPARRRTTPHGDVYEAPGLTLIRSDIFDVVPADLGAICAVYDRAALIAWAADRRPAYVQTMTRLTSPGTVTLLVTLEYAQAQMPGPPFSVPAAEVQRLYGDHHLVSELSRIDVLENEPRMRSRGVTAVHEVCYQLTRV